MCCGIRTARTGGAQVNDFKIYFRREDVRNAFLILFNSLSETNWERARVRWNKCARSNIRYQRSKINSPDAVWTVDGAVVLQCASSMWREDVRLMCRRPMRREGSALVFIDYAEFNQSFSEKHCNFSILDQLMIWLTHFNMLFFEYSALELKSVLARS